MARSGAPRAAVIQAEVLSDVMDETVSHFDVTCPTKRSILPRMTSRRLSSHTFASKKKMKKRFSRFIQSATTPITLRVSLGSLRDARQMWGFKTVRLILTLFSLDI